MSRSECCLASLQKRKTRLILRIAISTILIKQLTQCEENPPIWPFAFDEAKVDRSAICRCGNDWVGRLGVLRGFPS